MYSLGIEFSTQSVKMVILDITTSTCIYRSKFDYDDTFSKYATDGGVLSISEKGVRHTSPFMLIESLDLVFNKIKSDGVRLSKIKAVKIDAMQH